MDLDLNKILEDAGSFGLYQIYLCLFLVMPSAFFCALIYFAQFFIILIPNHWCALEDSNGNNDSSLDLNYIPFEIINGQKVLNNCYIYDKPIKNSLHLLSNISSHKCSNGWQYEYSSLYPTMATESNWVCDDSRQSYNVQTIFYVGTSIGCLLFGYISDKYGRKPSIIGSSCLACIAGIATCFATDYWTFSALRFLVGMSIIPLSEDPYVLSLEYIGAEKRTLAIIAWTFGYISASILCPWIAYYLKSWRLLCALTSAPILILIIGINFIPESAVWLITQGKTEKALQLLERVAKTNKRLLSTDLNKTELLLNEKDVKRVKNISSLNIFQMKRLRNRTLILAICWLLLFTCYHTNTQNTSNLGTDIYYSFTFGALVEIPATLFVFLSLDRLGRKWPMSLSMLTAGMAGLSTMFFKTDEWSRNYYLIIALVMRVSLATEYNIIIQYSTEVYPTVLRGRALAFLRFMGTLGLYVSPSIVYLAITEYSLPFLITGFMALIVAFISILLPETIHHNLPHSLQEGEDFGKNQKILYIPCIQTNQ